MSSTLEQIPMNVSAIYLDNTRIQVSFTAADFINSYYYKVVAYDNSGNYYNTTGTTSPIILSGLTENTLYNYYIETILTASSETIIVNTLSFPVITSFNITDISYDALKLNWIGEDFSYIYINRLCNNNEYAAIDISYIYNTTETEFYDTEDLSGNTSYSYSIIPYSTINDILYTGDITTQTAITTVAPVSDLSLLFYDNSAITVSFTAGRNYYINDIYYIVSVSAEGANVIDNSNSTAQSIQIADLSGNTDYIVSLTTIIDNSLNTSFINTDTLSVKTNIQNPIQSYIFSYDTSSVSISLGELPRNSYNNNIYYVLNAIERDNSNNLFSSIITHSDALLNNITTVQSLNYYTLYDITATIVIDDISGDIFNINSVKTIINTDYTINVSEIINKTIDISINSILDISFNTYINTNEIYYIITATDINNNIIDASSTTGSVILYGLSGNTDYIININTMVDGSSVISPSPSTANFTTAIQVPRDIVIDSFIDNSFTILFTPPRNTYETKLYYILRATDISSGDIFDISSETPILSMYNVPNIEATYDIDLITVVDNSMVSYGGLFTI